MRFHIQVTCRVFRDGVPFDVTLPNGGVLTLGDGGSGRFVVPTSSTCTVSEPNRPADVKLGFTDDDPGTPPGVLTVRRGGSTVRITATNTFPQTAPGQGGTGPGLATTGAVVLPTLGIATGFVVLGLRLRRRRRPAA
jgi:hypothetical protein